MQKLIYRNPNGEEVNLTDGDFGVISWSGFDNTNLEVQNEQVPFHDGSVYLDSLLTERDLSINVAINDNNNLEKRYELRSYLISILNPKLGEGELIYQNDFLIKRIVCIPHIPQFSNKNMNTSGSVKAKIDFTASDPYWEDLDDNIIECSKGNVFIENKGNVPTSLKFNFSTESMENLTIKNLTNNKKIELDETITKDIEINTGFGSKNVTSKVLQLKSFEGLNFKSIAFSQKDSLFMGVLGEAIAKSYNGIEWEIDYSNSFGLYLNKIIYSEHYKKFFLGTRDKLYSSLDGINWESVYTLNYGQITPLFCKDETIFLSIYKNNQYYLSVTSDFTTFNEVSYTINDVCYGNNLFVAVGNNGVIITSSDGETWTTRTSGINTTLSSICYDNNIFVTVGSSGVILSSSDAETWTTRTSGVESLFSNSIASVTYDSSFNLFVAVGAFTSILTSSDGETWTKIDFENVSFTNKSCAYYCDDLSLILVAGESKQVYTSNDGVDWFVLQDGTKSEFNHMIYDKYNNQFIAPLNGGIKTSPDGINWTVISDIVTNSISCNESGLYVCTKEYNTEHMMVSEDLITWREVDISSLVEFNEVMKLYYSKLINKFIAYGNGGTILVSPDGINWSKKESRNFALLSMCENDDLIVCTGNSNGIITSSDGETWTSRRYIPNVPNNDLPYCMYCKRNKKFITTYKGNVLTSPDGINWTRYNMVNFYGTDPINIIYHDFKNIYIGLQYYRIMISQDGINWDLLYDTTKFEDLIYSQQKNIVVLGGISSSYGVLNYVNEENLISYLTDDSDMSLNLEVGKNNLLISSIGNIRTRIQYRQKYLGV